MVSTRRVREKWKALREPLLANWSAHSLWNTRFCLLRSCLLILSLLLNLEKITKAYALGLLIYKIEIIVSTL